jgi:phospholipase C
VVAKLPTIWDSLAAAGVSAKYYYSDAPFIVIVGGAKYLPISFTFDQFLADCAAGELPSVSYVDPRFIGEDDGTAGDDHPFADIRVGQAFLDQVYTAVTTSPNWETTALVITYDEWGGFFDHVVPIKGMDNDPTHALRGFRVPLLMISPKAVRGKVGHELYDHTSILAMIEWRWGLAPLTPRDAHALNIARMLDLQGPADLTAPQWDVPPAEAIRAQPSLAPRSEHEQMWVDVADLAVSYGYQVP